MQTKTNKQILDQNLYNHSLLKFTSVWEKHRLSNHYLFFVSLFNFLRLHCFYQCVIILLKYCVRFTHIPLFSQSYVILIKDMVTTKLCYRFSPHKQRICSFSDETITLVLASWRQHCHTTPSTLPQSHNSSINCFFIHAWKLTINSLSIGNGD